MKAPLARIENVSHRFGTTPVLTDIELDVEAGSFTVLLGPSGSGKTTLLSILGGFIIPAQGRVLIDGEDCTRMAPAARPTATVFQDYALFPHMSVLANVGFGPRMRGVRPGERNAAALDMLRLVGLEEAAPKKPHQLSGGQRQRVALARALIMQPKVLLLDEPLGALDLKLRRQMQEELKAIQKRVGTAFVHVTHDQEEAMALADTVIVMNEGRIVDSGRPEEVYAHPRTRFSASFMGESNLLDGRVIGAEGSKVHIATALGRLTLPGSFREGEEIAIAIRPEKLRFGGGKEPSVHLGKAEVREIMFQGSFKRVAAEVEGAPGLRLVLRAAADAAISLGERIDLQCRPADIILLRG